MATTNIFMNAYKKPEDKLTYNFLCLIEHMENQKAFCEFLIDNKFELSESADVEIELQPSNQTDSIPDGKIFLRTSDDGECLLFFENKTHRMQLDIKQLKRHLKNYCQGKNTFLLVITPRDSDEGSVDSLNKQYDNKIVFKTWDQVAEKLKHLAENLEHLSSFLARQFVEYLCWEFEYMKEISSTEINDCCDYFKTDIHFTIRSILEGVASNIDFTQYCSISSKEWDDKDGRMGYKFILNRKYYRYRQWFFYGIYYNTKNHRIEFIKKGVPELAFFFDVDPNIKVNEYTKCREHLSQNGDFIRALGNLKKQHGFEESLTNNKITTNEYRLLFKRVPLTDLENFSYQDVRERFEKILSQLKNEEAFYQEMMAPPE